MRSLTYILLLIALAYVSTQGQSNLCTPAQNCRRCLLKGGDCYWCVDENFEFNRTRCNTKVNLERQGCKEYGMGSGSNSPDINQDFDDVIQVKPQRVTLKLRPGETQQFTIQIKPAKNYPVDLYYLMDMSKSMLDDLEKLTTLGTKIAQEIGSITTKYRLAFGSFVDKPVFPFVADEDPNYLHCKKNEANETGQLCVPAFGFRHIFSFSENAELFEDAVKKQKISGNLDTPEGGFDGLMQVAVCEKELGWKDKTRAHKIVIFVTDASPHIAGDGRIGGIITPNDAHCHLHNQGDFQVYSESKTMDYPSIGLLKAKLKEYKVIPIFAVTNEVINIYKKLASEWTDLGAVTGILKNDSSNIVELIRDNYNAISTTVKLSDNSGPDITVAYRVQSDPTHPNACPNMRGDNECVDVNVTEGNNERKNPIDFEVYVTAKDANCDVNKNRSFTINIPGFGDTVVAIEMICDCECSKTREENSTKCTSQGTYTCGSCKCNQGREGDNCQCNQYDSGDISSCRHSNVTDKICSDFGICECGVCKCFVREDPKEVIDGQFCQCTNFNCPRHNSQLCGGKDRGRCQCNDCICEPGYQGENCGKADCTIAVKDCLNSKGENCSSHGKCDCGKCLCDKGYYGEKCEESVLPPVCTSFSDCISCQVFNKGKKEVCDNCTNLNIIRVNQTIEQCVLPVDENCFIIFSYETDDFFNNVTFHVLNETRCIKIMRTKPPILTIVLGTIGGIVLLVLLLLLLWKMVITAYDNYEYQRFAELEDKRYRRVTIENKLYRPAMQQFENPEFSGNQ